MADTSDIGSPLSLLISYTNNNNLNRNYRRITSSSFACNSFPSTTSPNPISIPSVATHRFSPPHSSPAHCLCRSRSIVTASQRRLCFLSLLPSFAFSLRRPTPSDAVASFLGRCRQIPSVVSPSLSLDLSQFSLFAQLHRHPFLSHSHCPKPPPLFSADRQSATSITRRLSSFQSLPLRRRPVIGPPQFQPVLAHLALLPLELSLSIAAPKT